MAVLYRCARRRSGLASQIGFTLIELAIVMVVAGLLLVPLLRMAGSTVISTRLKQTQSALQTASESLIAFAAINNGCLPFAADAEGGQPDTDASGSASANPDDGSRTSNVNAGDLPWADLGLTNSLLDGDGLRIQYYAATPYTDLDVSTSKITCVAGFRGFQYVFGVAYNPSSVSDIWVYDIDPYTSLRTIYKILGNNNLPGSTHPSDAPANKVDPLSLQMALPDPLLEVRRGPDVTAAAPENDIISSQNVFILIAPGKNRNTGINRLFVRDSTHTTSTGGVWALGVNVVDDHIFSTEPNVDASDSANSGDDTMLVMSFTRFKAEMSKHGLNMEAICETTC